MICSNCKSSDLVEKEGSVVCTRCGLVNCKVYDPQGTVVYYNSAELYMKEHHQRLEEAEDVDEYYHTMRINRELYGKKK